MRGTFLALSCVLLTACTASAVTILGAEEVVRIPGGGVGLWAIEAPDALAPDVSLDQLRDRVQLWARCGCNGMLITCQSPKRSLFAPDGQIADVEMAKRFTELADLMRNHFVGLIVNLYSVDPAARLASPEAYRQAARNAAKLIPERHGVIFVIGDVIDGRGRSSDSSWPLNKPGEVLAQAREINKVRSDIMLAVPADAFRPASSRGKETPLIYATRSREMIEPLIAHLARAKADAPLPAEWANKVAVIEAGHVLIERQGQQSLAKTLPTWLEAVERTRLAVQAPLASGPADGGDTGLTEREKNEGFVSLFDGKSLNGWTTLQKDWGAWSVQDGTLYCAGKAGPWLRTRKRFSSFVLRFDFKIGKGGNSGVFVWAPLDGRCSRFGMEMQIRGRHDTEMGPYETTGAIYGVVPPIKDATGEPGEWNVAEIRCDGFRVTMTINGQLVQDVDADKVPELKPRLRSGFIGLQDHRNPVWFRHLRIRELPDSKGSRPNIPSGS